MSDAPNAGQAKRTADQDLEVWKHFAGMGGHDKNTMITTVSWLLALAATAIGYIVTSPDAIAPGSVRILHPGRMIVVTLLGVILSGIAAYLTLLYGGYSNRNWAKADEIALEHSWFDLGPDRSPAQMTPERGGKPGFLAPVAWRLSRPCLPQTELAPAVKIFALLAGLSGLTHGFLLGASIHALLHD